MTSPLLLTRSVLRNERIFWYEYLKILEQTLSLMERRGEESAEEEGVQQYVPRYATMEEYAVGAKKAKGSQTIDIHTVSTC